MWLPPIKHPTLPEKMVSKIDMSAPKFNSILAFSLLNLPTAFAYLNHLPGVRYFHYPCEFPGERSISIFNCDRAFHPIVLDYKLKTHMLILTYTSDRVDPIV